MILPSWIKHIVRVDPASLIWIWHSGWTNSSEDPWKHPRAFSKWITTVFSTRGKSWLKLHVAKKHRKWMPFFKEYSANRVIFSWPIHCFWMFFMPRCVCVGVSLVHHHWGEDPVIFLDGNFAFWNWFVVFQDISEFMSSSLQIRFIWLDLCRLPSEVLERLDPIGFLKNFDDFTSLTDHRFFRE